MKTSSCKAKGRRCCQEVSSLLYTHAPELRAGDIEITSSGCTGEDLKLSPAARDIYPWTIECKNVEKLNVWDALAQVEAHVKDRTGIEPLLFFKRNRSKLYVAMSAEYFVKAFRKV